MLRLRRLAARQRIWAIKNTVKRFHIGLQFHPECLYLGDERMNRIFQEFISAAREKRSKLIEGDKL